MSEAVGLGVTAWSPLAGGVLTGKYAEGRAEADARMNSEMMKGYNRAGRSSGDTIPNCLGEFREIRECKERTVGGASSGDTMPNS